MSTTAPRRFILIDQTLESFQGHHYEYAAAVADAAARAGFEVEVWANRRIGDLSLPGAKILPVFSVAWSGPAAPASLKSRISSALNDTAWGARVYRLLRAAYRAVPRGRQEAGAFESELLERMRQSRLAERDLVFIPTLSIAEASACVRAGTANPSGPSFHLLFRRDPDESSVALGLASLLRAVEALPAGLRSKFRFYTDTDELSGAYGRASSIRFETLPIPLLKRRFTNLASRGKSPDRLCLAYLGDARAEKGFHHLPAIADAISKLQGKPEIVMTIQANPTAAEDDAIRAAREALRRFPRARVRLLDRELSPEEYLDLLREADAVVLPYQAGTYRYRSSGVFAEAVAAGRPCIVPAGSWMSHQIRDGSGLSYSSEKELVAQLDRLRSDFEQVRSRCAARSEAWLAHHSPENLVKALSS